MRAVALLGPAATEQHVRRFELPGVNVFAGNELDPTDQPEVALVFGGDGTIHRHLWALSIKQVPVLVVPMGSANDFANSMNLGTLEKSLAAWRRFCAGEGNVRAIDLGTVMPLGREASSERNSKPWSGVSLEAMHFVPDGARLDLPKMGPRIMQSQLRRAMDTKRELGRETVFCCIAGTGLDAAVNRRTLKQSRWLRAHGGYVFALLRVLGRFRPPHMHVAAEMNGEWRIIADEPGLLVAAGNGPQYGHGMRLTHLANMEDGQLDVCFVRCLSKLRLLRLFRLVFRGEHIGLKEVEYVKAKRVRVTTDPVTELFADGEPICQTPVEIGVRTKALRIIT